jgi:glycosyltransferase involved in cell wall biosynthesis
MGLGRLEPQKDLATLVRAFARVRRDRPARLLIVGAADKPADTPGRTATLRALATEQGVADDLDLPGWTDNPFAWLSRAAVFVLSSRHEGFGNVLVEALACGCPVVSTDCPSGPAEILESGRYGRLVPVGDDVAMAEAIGATLDTPPDRVPLRERAGAFTARRGVARYEALLGGLVDREHPSRA